MKKKIIIPVFMLTCAFFLTGCSKVSLTGNSTGTNNNGAPTDMQTPPDGGTPPEDGGTPPTDMGTPPDGAPAGGPSEN